MLRNTPLTRRDKIEEGRQEGKALRQLVRLLRCQRRPHSQVRERRGDRLRREVRRRLPRQVQRLRRPRQDVRHQGVRLQGSPHEWFPLCQYRVIEQVADLVWDDLDLFFGLALVSHYYGYPVPKQDEGRCQI